jgi:copper chaperone
MTNVTFTVPDMSCGHCKAAIEGALDKIEGVERSKADPESKLVEITFDGGRVTIGELKEAVEEAGYAAGARRGTAAGSRNGKRRPMSRLRTGNGPA